jgi:hypothetical protein
MTPSYPSYPSYPSFPIVPLIFIQLPETPGPALAREFLYVAVASIRRFKDDRLRLRGTGEFSTSRDIYRR